MQTDMQVTRKHATHQRISLQTCTRAHICVCMHRCSHECMYMCSSHADVRGRAFHRDAAGCHRLPHGLERAAVAVRWPQRRLLPPKVVSPISRTRVIYTCVMTYLYVRHGAFMCVSSLIHTWSTTIIPDVVEQSQNHGVVCQAGRSQPQYARDDSRGIDTQSWRIYMCSYVCKDSFIPGPWRKYMCHDSTQYTRDDGRGSDTHAMVHVYLFHTCAMTRSYPGHGAFIFVL